MEPLLIDAKNVSLASRPSSFWTDVDIQLSPGETVSFTTKDKLKTLNMVISKTKLSALDADSTMHPSFSGTMKCFTGYCRKSKPPREPVGIDTASKEAVKRWERDSFATNIFHYEDSNMVYSKDDKSFANGRLPSISEMHIDPILQTYHSQ